MELRIVFYKSSSKYYESCCMKCELFDSYSNEGSKNTLTINENELREKRSQLSPILEIIKNWTKTEYYLEDTPCTSLEVDRVLQLLGCEQAKSSEVVGDHCFALNGWGCNRLDEITFSASHYSYGSKYYWYDFGQFRDGIWKIDKERIKEYINGEAERKHLTICSHFDIERVYTEVDKLPDEIIVTDDETCTWEYKYREAAAGICQSEVIGVAPRNRYDSYSGSGFSIRVNDNRDDNSESKADSQRSIPDVSFSDIGGLDQIIQQVREVIELPMIAPDIFKYYHLTPHKGILLYGPPGCGKTLIAKAIANEIGAHFIVVNGPEILNKYIGESERNLRNVFENAKKNSPSIIYFDEFDAISQRRDSDDHLSLSTVVNQLLTLMDGITKNDICCIASTNRIDMIDEAIKRPGRFDYVIEIEKPSPEGCLAIFEIHTEQMPVEESFDKAYFVKNNLIGLTGAEIAFVASEAAYNSIRRTVDMKRVFAGEGYQLSDQNQVIEFDFINAVKTLKERKKRAYSAQFRYNS